MFALPVTAYEIILFNLSKWSVFESMTFREYDIIISSYNVTKYVVRWLLMACKMVKKWRIYVKLFLCVP